MLSAGGLLHRPKELADVPAVILAGGRGSRLSEETDLRPKPMVNIGGRPILWHILKIYGVAGCSKFIIALGYKGEVVKDYFINFRAYMGDLEIDLQGSGEVQVHKSEANDWNVVLADTGDDTQTGGRIKRLERWLKNDDVFMLTYGDGLADIDIRRLWDFHCAHGRLATVTAVRPPARFGSLTMSGDEVTHMGEKAQAEAGWINGGFFVLHRRALEYISGDEAIWEREPMERLVEDGQLAAYRHEGFWQPMDTLREKRLLEDLWETGNAPWKVW